MSRAAEPASPSGGDLVYYPNSSAATTAVVRDPNKVTVRLGARPDALGPTTGGLLRERAAPIAELPEYGLTVYGFSPAEAVQAVQTLNRERDVQQAAPVLHRADGDTDDIYVTDRFVVQFLPEVTRERIGLLNAEYGVTVVEELGYAANGFLLAVPPGPDGLGALHTANAYRGTGLTRFAHPDLITRRHRRTAAAPAATRTGPCAHAVRDVGYVARQWHLSAAGVTDAWTLTHGDQGIAVAVLDDGTDTGHPEFAGKLGPQYDFASHTADASPKSDFENHGTACAGVATARGLRAAGAAPECTLLLARFPDFLGSADEARMFQWAADNGADVISCSWGPPDGRSAYVPLPGSTEAATAYCAQQGRGGKGIPICWAAGNGNESVDTDGYSCNPNVMAIGATTDRERRAWYSDHGDAIWICAPSSGAASLGEHAVLTTDRTGSAGYNDGSEGVDPDYTDSFGGTSAAAPLVAGIAALMLSVNPQLTAQDVRGLLRDTARTIGTGYGPDGHSPDYGYGQVDAYAAVRAAQRQAPARPAGSPSITGPATAARSGPSPAFALALTSGGSRVYYAVEVATDPRLFQRQAHQADRTPDTFYASWQDSGFLGSADYRLPDAVWQRVGQADALYYRAWFSTSPMQWQGAFASTEDAAFLQAPAITVTSGAPALHDAPATRDAPVIRDVPPAVRAPASGIDPDELAWRRW
ncbi:S8 family serine peptidase [Kitasatospora sp. NPDC101183]|uniref:S8 family serine peptidase n=1 Tax=Kitasatospora sp. NPDC101183 TaxID=3364100 RepID=UPI00380E1DAB